MRIKNILISSTSLFIIWILLNNSIETPIVIIGIVVSLIISILLCNNCEYFSEIKLTPKAIYFSFIYVFVFLKELIVSNFDMAYRVLSPSLPINPGIVEVKTKLKSHIGRLALANSITLTPGTFTIDISNDILYIHWIDVKSEDIEKDTEIIVRKFEKYLEVMYG